MMMRTLRSVFIASNVPFFLVGGNQITHEHSLAFPDETSLMQAAAKAKVVVMGGAEEVQASSCQSFGGICLESEMPFDFPEETNLELLDSLPVPDSAATHPVKSDKIGPDAALVLLVRRALWLISFFIAANGAMKWLPEAKCSKTTADTCVDFNSVHREANSGVVLEQSALHKAALDGNDMGCEFLLLQTPDEINETDDWGTTALHAAATGGSKLVVELFLEHGASVDPLNSREETPLHLAARGGHAEVCKLLVRNGASLRATNAEGLTPLVVAGFEEQEEVCSALLALGAGNEDLSEEDLPEVLRKVMAR